METSIELRKVIEARNAMADYQDSVYLKLMKKLNEQEKSIMVDDFGKQFVTNCSRDIASEVVRNCFQTSDYHITVDQLALRILKFDYKNDYDPLSENGGDGEIQKDVYNYNEIKSDRLDEISRVMDESQKTLFTEKRKNDNTDSDARKKYADEKRAESPDGTLYDEITGRKESKQTRVRKQSGKEYQVTDMQADHIQPRAAATYNERYVTQKGVDELKTFWNSSDNFEMMQQVANGIKSDVRVCEVTENGKTEIKYLTSQEMDMMQKEANHDGKDILVKDISYKATPEQEAEAVIAKLENGKKLPGNQEREGKNEKQIQALKDNGYLDENGKVPKNVKKELVEHYRHSMNKESQVILKNTNYKAVAKDAAGYTKSSMGKVIAGQVIYYAAPPLIFEVRTIIADKNINLDNALSKLTESAKRVGDYVISKLKYIFKNIAINSLKNFVKSFMDILINLVKATVKKMLKMVKNVLMSTVDAIRILTNKNASRAEKADSLCNLFAITVTNCVVELLFEVAGDVLHIPEPFDDIIFGPLQILTSIICTNLVLLVLKKADLFDVQYGFKMSQIRKLFKETEQQYLTQLNESTERTNEEIQMIIMNAKKECVDICHHLEDIDVKQQSAREDLERINKMFNMGIDFEKDWNRFMGYVAC